jgi:hypothetical protein
MLNDATGITDYGDNSDGGALTAAVTPYPNRIINFPIQVGATVQQFNKTDLDYGSDIDGDGRNDFLDASSKAIVYGFETISTAAGTFQNCLRVDTNIIVTVTLSTDGAKYTIKGINTDWYAQDIGQVKQTTVVSGYGQSEEITEELIGYMVNGRSNGVSLSIGVSSATVDSGASTKLSVTLLDSVNSPLIAVPAVWTSGNNAIATVDVNGMATGVAVGATTLTPSIGGVTGPPMTLNVWAGFKQGLSYSGLTSFYRFGDTAIGDLNGDGRNDVAVLEITVSRILVYDQTAGGLLNQPRVISTTLNLTGIAIKDVNNDGFADLIVSGNQNTPTSGWKGRVLVFKQDPLSHTLGTPQEYVIPGGGYVGTLVVADLNNDGLPDVATESPGSDGLISFLFQKPNGSLGPVVPYTAVPVGITDIHVADMNGDGLNDVVFQSGPKQLAVIKQTSSGIFNPVPDFYTFQINNALYIESFALGDLNSDGRPDIAVTDYSGDINIFLQNTNGTFLPSQILNFFASELKIFDIDGDGLNDLLLLESGNTVKVLRQSAAHSFQDVQTYSLQTKTTGGTSIHQAMSLGDVTGDGLPDIVFSWADDGVFVIPRRK